MPFGPCVTYAQRGMKDGGGGDVTKEEHGRRHAEDTMSGHLKPAVHF